MLLRILQYHLYYKVLLQYYCTTKYATQVLLCTTSYCSSTTKCYSSTTLHYKVPLQCCSVHCSGATRYHSNTTQSIAEHYSSTTLHHYCVLQSATPVLLCSATPVALLKWSGRGCRRPGSFEKRLLMQEAAADCARTQGQQSSSTTYSNLNVLERTTYCQYCLVLQSNYCSSTTTTKCYSNATLHYKVRLQHYSFRCCSSATPNNYYSAPRCTKEYYSSTNVCYKVLLQYCWERRGAGTPALGTFDTKCYSSTTYSNLNITPVLPCTTE